MTMVESPPLFPFAGDLSADSAPELARLRAAAPLARVRLPDGQLAWLALRYADVKQVFNDPRFSREAATRPGAPSVSPSTAVPGMLIGLDPPEHTRIRRLVSRAFSARTIDAKRPRIQAIVDGLLDELRDHGAPADLVTLFSYPLPLTVITEILGVPYADRGQFQQVVAVIMAASAHPPEEIQAAIGELVAYLVRAGEAIIPSGHIANSDPEIWPDGRRLDVTRTEAVPHLTFGYGPHHCVGAALARLELQIALAALLARFPTIRLAVPAERLRWRPGMLMRTLQELPVTW